MKRPFISLATALLALLYSGCGDEVTNMNGPADWQGPVVEWAASMDAEVRGTIGLDVSVLDSSAILRVKLYVDGGEDQTLTAPPYRFMVVTDSLPDGVHLCETRAWDQYENLGISPVLRVNVANSVAQGPRVIWVPGDYGQIQSAINAATDFDTIRVRDGTYYETLNLFGKGIWIESEHGPLRCEINAAGSFSAFTIPGPGTSCTIRGFKICGGDHLVYLDTGGILVLVNNVIGFDTSYTHLITGSCGGLIANNLFSGGVAAVQISYFWGKLVNNVLQNASSVALHNAALFENPLFHGFNIFWNNERDYGVRFTQGPGEFVADPLIDLENGRLLPGSPCIDAGDPASADRDSSFSDIGPFGGPYSY